MTENNPFDWRGSAPRSPNEEAWRNYFNLLLTSMDDSISNEFKITHAPMYDDPQDFINGFTLAGSFFTGLHLEPDEEKRKEAIVSFRRTLATYLLSILGRLEYDER